MPGFNSAGFYPNGQSRSAARRPSEWGRGHTGVRVVSQNGYRDWKIEITRRRLGMTFAREVFTASIERQEPDLTERLSGFASAAAAHNAARQRIDFIQQMHLSGPHWKRPTRKP